MLYLLIEVVLLYLMNTMFEASMMLQFKNHPRRLPIKAYINNNYDFNLNKYTWDSIKIAAKWPEYLFQWIKKGFQK